MSASLTNNGNPHSAESDHSGLARHHDISVDSANLALVNEIVGASGNTNTSNSMAVGDIFSGNLESAGDSDWIAIDLAAGQGIQIAMNGSGLSDPFLSLRNLDGIEMNIDDDGGPGQNSLLSYTATVAGTYYIVAESFNSAGSGTYEVEVSAATETYPSFDILDVINTGFTVSDTSIDVYFGVNGYTADGITSEGFNAFEIAQFEAVFAQIESLTDLTFNTVTSAAAADFRLILDTNEGAEYGNALGYFYLPTGGGLAGTGVFNGAIWDRSAGGNLEAGGYGYVTIAHELLHGVGLAHPHDTGGGSDILAGVGTLFNDIGAYGLNQGVYTTLTYNNGYYTGTQGAISYSYDYGYEAGPMALDIALLQQLYGVNNTTNTGDDVYMLAGANASGTYWSSIWDAGGTDELQYSGALDVVIDLRAATIQDAIGGGGYVSSAAGIAGGFTIARNVVIDNATTGSGDDFIGGNTADNLIMGGGGNDVIRGRAGDDTIYGEEGNDTLTGGTGSDTLYGGDGLNNLIGQRDADILYGGSVRDILNGGGGQDELWGFEGNDRLKGGPRADELYGGDGADKIYGNRQNDTLFGGAGDDLLNGGGDDDYLEGGSGDDFLKGGSGADSFVFVTDADEDKIVDYSIGEDALLINASYWAGVADGQDMIDQYANITAQGVVFDFGDGDVLILRGLTTTAGLADDIGIG